jgi:hypothetical protein
MTMRSLHCISNPQIFVFPFALAILFGHSFARRQRDDLVTTQARLESLLLWAIQTDLLRAGLLRLHPRLDSTRPLLSKHDLTDG